MKYRSTITGASLTGTTLMYRDTGALRIFAEHNKDAKLTFDFQFPHRWAGGPVIPHLHYIPMAAGAGDVILRLAYSWATFDEEEGALDAWTTLDDVTLALSSVDQYKNKVLSFGAIPAHPGAGASTFLNVRLERLGDDVGDTYTTSKDHGTAAANFCIRAFDIHALMTRSGTETELA